MVHKVFFTFRDITQHMQRYVTSCVKFHHIISKKQLPNVEEQSSDDRGMHEVPDEIMEKLINRLNLGDQIRLSIVNKSWRSVIMNNKTPNNTHEFPWLVLPQSQDCKKDKTLSFYSLSYGKVVELELPKPIRGAWFCGSSKGWLIMIKEKGLNSQIFLLNPISRAFRQLPSLAMIPSFQNFVKEKYWELYGRTYVYQQVSLSNSDINSDECIVAVTFKNCDNYELWLCQPRRDSSWHVFPFSNDENDRLLKFSFFGGNKLYAVVVVENDEKDVVVVTRTLIFGDRNLELVTVYVNAYNILGQFRGEFIQLEMHNDHFVFLNYVLETFLIESTNDELLMIIKVDDKFINRVDENDEDDAIVEGGDDIEEGIVEGDHEQNEINEEDDDVIEDGEVENDWKPVRYLRTSQFYVFKIESKNGESCYTRISSLGDQVLFVANDDGSCFSLDSANFEEYEKNRIYFAFSLNGTYKSEISNTHTSREIGVFDLSSGKIKRSFPSVNNISTHSRLCWYVPRL